MRAPIQALAGALVAAVGLATPLPASTADPVGSVARMSWTVESMDELHGLLDTPSKVLTLLRALAPSASEESALKRSGISP